MGLRGTGKVEQTMKAAASSHTGQALEQRLGALLVRVRHDGCYEELMHGSINVTAEKLKAENAVTGRTR